MESIWLQTTELPRFPALENNITCDVLIIGGGITGLLTALYLHNKGIDYILVEKGRIAHGTTANTTAKITFQHGLCYNKLLKQVGLESAQMYLKANQSAFDELCKLAKSLNCDFEWRDNFVYSVTDRKKLENEMKALSTLGFNAELCDRPTIPIETVGAVKFKHQAQFNPLKFLKETIKEVKEKSDYVVLLIHWGKEDSHELEEVIKVTGREYIDEGADLIIGSHAHLLQGMEIYNNKLIAYNLGDFIFNRETKDTGILSVTLNKKGNLSYKFIPCKQDNYKTSLLEGKEKDRVLNNMNTYSINTILSSDGTITELTK